MGAALSVSLHMRLVIFVLCGMLLKRSNAQLRDGVEGFLMRKKFLTELIYFNHHSDTHKCYFGEKAILLLSVTKMRGPKLHSCLIYVWNHNQLV